VALAGQRLLLWLHERSRWALPEAVVALDSDIERAASCVLAGAATAWLADEWAGLAARAEAATPDRAATDGHPAALWLRGRRWPEALAAAQSVESWHRKPQALAWATEARLSQDGARAALPWLAELAWLAPTRLHGIAVRSVDPILNRWWSAFEQGFDPEPGAVDAETESEPEAVCRWWPAWLVLEQPNLAPALALARPGMDDAAERAARCALALLRLEGLGRSPELLSERRRLQSLHAGLFAAYLRRR
jgi:hypothetical protein